MPFTGMHEKAQNQAEGISNRQLEEQTRITIQALEELTADAAKTAKSAVLLALQATKLAADTIKLTLKIFKHITSFLKQAAAKAAKSVRAGINHKTQSFTKSLKEFFARKPKLGVNIIQEIQGSEREQAQKLLQLLNTPAGDRAPDGLAGIGIKLGGENLLVVGKDNRVEINLIQPLMESEVIQAAMNENLVPAAIAPEIQPLQGSLGSHEADLQALLIANEAVQKAESQLDPEIYRELESLIATPLASKIPTVAIGTDGIVEDPFESPSIPDRPIGYEPDPNPIESQSELVSAPVTPKLASELVTIAQLHQVGTPATTLTLPLAQKDGSDLEYPTLLTQIPQANGETSYEFETQGANPQKFSFTVNQSRIVTSFQIDPRQDPRSVGKLVTSVANIATSPDRTDFQPHPESNLEGIETLQALNTSLRELNSSSQKPVSAAEVTLDDSKFGVKNERDRGVTIVDTATGKTMTVTDNGIEDGGLLKTMMEKAKNGDLLGRKLVAMAQEKANQIKTLVANATPIIMEVVTEGVNRDRDGKIAAKNAVERLGSEIDGLIGAAQQTIAPSPDLSGTIDRMKQIDRVEAGAEQQVAAIVDVLPSIEEPQLETPEQMSLQERLNAEIAQNGSQADPKAKAQSQQVQPSL
jgi:hypothetical protein